MNAATPSTDLPPSVFPQPTLIPVAACAPRPGNRDTPVDAELRELAVSIRVVGLINPIHVVALGKERFEIYAGVRRWKAHRLNEADVIPAVVHPAPDDRLAEQIRLIENLHRAEPTAFDIARSLRRLKNARGYSYAETAADTGMSLSNVKRYLGIFTASDELLLAAEKAQLPLKVVAELVRYESALGEVETRRILPRVVSGELSARELTSRRKRKNAAGAPATRKPRAPAWDRLSKQIETAAGKKPEAARAGLKAIIRRCNALLKELPAA